MLSVAVRRELVNRLQSAGAQASTGSSGEFLVSAPAGRAVQITPVQKSVLSAGRARDVASSLDTPSETLALVVADKIPAPARAVLNEAGVAWYDRRGHLRIVAPGLLIDTDVAPSTSLGGNGRDFPSGRTGVGVAATLLIARASMPEGSAWSDIEPSGARIAELTGVSASGVSETLKTFRQLGYLQSDGSPAVPDLFEATVEHWKPRWVALAAPIEDAPDLPHRRADLDDPTHQGWCLAGDAAAAAWRAPIVGGDIGPRSWYVPDADTLDTLRWTVGEADPGEAATHVAVAPSPVVCRLRVVFDNVGPVEPLAAAALDLALDQARGLEIMEEWTPTNGTRVW